MLVLRAEGSCPAPAGALAVLDEAGQLQGTVGGGAPEAAALEAAQAVQKDGRARRIQVALQGTDAAEMTPVCGGQMEFLVWEPNAGERAAFGAAARALVAGEGGVLRLWLPGRSGPDAEPPAPSHDVEPSPPVRESVWQPAAMVPAFPPQAGLTSLADPAERAREVFDLPLLPRLRVIVAGGGHVGQAVARCATDVGFAVEVVEDRPEFCRRELFPAPTRIHPGDMAASLRNARLGPESYVVIVTRNHRRDAEVLEASLGRGAAYVGMIGSRRKVALVRSALLASGRVSERDLEAVHAPIGLDIGAVTPAEIAVSIVAEIIAVRRRWGASSEPRRSGS